MNPENKNKPFITVFCGSSARVADHFLQDARHVAAILCEAGLGVVYGGGSVGLMGALADEILARRGLIRGVIPRFMVEREWVNKQVLMMDIVDSMSQRKDLMLHLGDLVLALPGGLGTLDEFLEAVTLKQLGRLNSPLLLYNPKGYFDPLMVQLDHMRHEQFVDQGRGEIWQVLDDLDALKLFVQNWLKEADIHGEVPHASS